MANSMQNTIILWIFLKEKLTSNITFCPHVVAFRQIFRKFPGQKISIISFSMANLLGQTFFLLHDGKFCKEKLEAGPGFQFSTFADRVREISWGRDFKRDNLFFSWQSRGRGFKKLLGTRRAIEEVIGQCLSILLRSHPRILRSRDHSSSTELLRSHLVCTVLLRSRLRNLRCPLHSKIPRA